MSICCPQYELVCSWAFELGWPSPHNCVHSAADAESSDKSSTSQQFYEGSFLRVLLDKLSHMLYQVPPGSA